MGTLFSIKFVAPFSYVIDNFCISPIPPRLEFLLAWLATLPKGLTSGWEHGELGQKQMRLNSCFARIEAPLPRDETG